MGLPKKKLQPIFEEAADVAFDTMTGILTNFRPHPLKKDSKLIRSFQAKVQQGRMPNGTFDVKKITLSMNFYGQFLDSGRRRGARGVPIDVLMKWIRENRLQGRSKKGRFISTRSLAFVIQASIKRKGIKKRNFILPAIKAADNYLKSRDVSRNIMNVLTQDLDSWFNKK